MSKLEMSVFIASVLMNSKVKAGHWKVLELMKKSKIVLEDIVVMAKRAADGDWKDAFPKMWA